MTDGGPLTEQAPAQLQLVVEPLPPAREQTPISFGCPLCKQEWTRRLIYTLGRVDRQVDPRPPAGPGTSSAVFSAYHDGGHSA